MKNTFHKGLALALSLILVLSVCFIGGMVATAVPNEENATITQTIYGNHELNTAEKALEKIGDLSKSLISGKTPYYYDGTSFVSGGDNNNFVLMTDNAIGNFSNIKFCKQYSYEYEGTNYSGNAQRMYYDLGADFTVDEIVLVDASNTDASNLTLPSFKVFLSETANEHLLFDIWDQIF